MNSLNILSSRVIGQSSNSTRPRSKSQDESQRAAAPGDLGKLRSYSQGSLRTSYPLDESHDDSVRPTEDNRLADTSYSVDEKSRLINGAPNNGALVTKTTWRLITQCIFDAITETARFILSTFAAPGLFVAQCFRDDDGCYSLSAPLKKVWKLSVKSSIQDKGVSRARSRRRSGSIRKLKPQTSREFFMLKKSESDSERGSAVGNISGKSHRPSKSLGHDFDPSPDDSTPRRSIRIKLQNEESLKRQRRHTRSADRGPPMAEGVSQVQSGVNLDNLKSPTSPSVHRLTKYPHSPTPPRPLLPPRLPSYTAAPRNAKFPQKTLVLDLDETLIHSLAKGGRMSSGHMVEVKLSIPMSTALTPGGPQTTLGPQHPILYYVHKRPHCDEFLRKICKWYKLVIFTASVQEYADAVIDWLEQERKYFQARYYRQHCTLRNGAYIKDLSFVEPDLSKVMILDNSPMSYIFHEGRFSLRSSFDIYIAMDTNTECADNAIPIEGWINDPTDNHLLHLIPLLEALQYVTDVRALLALRRGEIET